jgi:hypothetical protein
VVNQADITERDARGKACNQKCHRIDPISDGGAARDQKTLANNTQQKFEPGVLNNNLQSVCSKKRPSAMPVRRNET